MMNAYMRWMREASWRVRWLGRRKKLEHGLAEEMRFHVDQQIEKNLHAGLDVQEARRQALIMFGGVENSKERARDEFRLTSLEDVLRDLRHGLRALRRTPSFTVIACFTLAIGIGAATAVFSIINGVLLKPLPYPDADALVGVWHRAPGIFPGDVEISATQYFTYRDENRTFQEFGLWAAGSATATGRSEAEQVQSLLVTYSTLEALGIRPGIGRWFSQEDDTPGSPETVILVDGYWQRRYGGDPSVIGRSIIIDARPRVVIGVMPAHFQFLTRKPDVILPFRFDRATLSLGQFNYQGLARLRPHVTLAAANADVARMLPIWLNAWPTPRGVNRQQLEKANISPALHPLKQDVVGDVGNVLWIVMATVGVVLLIACANVANLVLLRTQTRRSELAVRMALGASWYRITRGLLLENMLLALVSGTLGIGIAVAALRLLVAIAPANLPRLDNIAIDQLVLAFALAAILFSGALFGLLASVKHIGSSVELALRGSRRTSTEGPEAHRMRNALVVAQVALALVLLIGSGLMVRTLLALRAIDPGFADAAHVQMVRITAPAQIREPERVLRLQVEIRDRLSAILGVASASFASAAPLEPFAGGDVVFADDRTYGEGALPAVRRFKFVAPGFFDAVGTRLIAGRDLTWADLYERALVVVVSENVARELWQDPQSAIGKRIRENSANPWREIVGVVADVHDSGMHVPAPTIVYWPALLDHFGKSGGLQASRTVTFVIRSDRAGLEDFINEIRQAVWAVDPGVPLAQIRTLRLLYDDSLARTSFTLVVLGIAAATAFLLGIVGIYGTIAYMVTQRTREIGVRLALGAQDRQIRRAFVRHGVVLTAIGVASGCGAAVGLTRFMSALLYGISPIDATTYVAVAVLLLTAAAVASYIPARKATAVNLLEVLRSDS